MKEAILEFLKYQFTMHRGRTIGCASGLIISILILLIGFFSTLFIAICILVGIYVGNLIDKQDDFLEEILYRIQRWRLPFFRR